MNPKGLAMGAKRQAKKQFEKDKELEKLRNRAAAAQQRKEMKQAMLDAIGEGETSMPDTTKLIAKAIKDVKVTCNL